MNNHRSKSSLSTESSDGESREETGSLLTNRYRLWIHGANLPRQGRMRGKSPSSYAVVTGAAFTRDQTEYHVGTFSPGEELGRTEVVGNNRNPQFTETITLDYEYGSKYFFFVHIFLAATDAFGRPIRAKESKKKLLGTARFEVGDILSAKHHSKVRRLREGGSVFCRLEPPRSIRDVSSVLTPTRYLRFRLAARDLVLPSSRRSVLSGNLFHSQPDTIVTLSKTPETVTRKAWVQVFRSQIIANTLSPMWDLAVVDLDTLCRGGDIHERIRISVLAVRPHNEPSLIGFCETTVRYLMEAAAFRQTTASAVRELPPETSAEEGSEFILQPRSDKLTDVGRLKVLDADIVSEASGSFQEVRFSELEQGADIPDSIDISGMPVIQPEQLLCQTSNKRRTFNDLVKAGCRLNFCVAIDFTSSNGDPRSETSLHYQSDSLNDYEESILAVGQAVERYGQEQSNMYSVWGFGAKFGVGGEVQHLFQCGANPRVQGVDGILESYKSIFESGFTMSGPTVFLKVIQAAAMQAKAQHDRMTSNNMGYTVLLVITDGIMDDFDETYRKIQVYKELPLSILFVGVGRSDFSTLSRLCECCPENTTFVEFRSQVSPFAFALAALENLPGQVAAYMTKRGV